MGITEMQAEFPREELGKIVRCVWVNYCIETNHVYKPDHVDSWEQLDEWAKEVDRRIGEAVAQHVIATLESTPLELARQRAILEAEILLTNYLVDGKFPTGSDCEAVRDLLRKVIE